MSNRSGRPPKYDWEDKRDICHRLYVDEKLSGGQIIKYFADHFGVSRDELPSINQFYAHFRTWGFPPRREKIAGEAETRIVARVKELFDQNLAAADILRKVQDEGWDINDYQFRVLRRTHDMLLKSGFGYKRRAAPKQQGTRRKRKRASDADGSEDGSATADNDGKQLDEQAEERRPQPLAPEEAARRAQNLADLQVQSDQLLQSRKRRRRIRGYGALPPDAPGMQPRYGSETSLDECKAFLQLSNQDYISVRQQYADICRDMGVVKMSLCQPGEWQESKDRLVRNNVHLSSVLHPLQPEVDSRLNALNCICSDVTKRMRNEGKFVSIADANNILDINPHQSKEIRRDFYEVLEADHFTNVVACGKEHLAFLREQWYAKSPFLKLVVAENDPRKMKAVEVLYRDARKRYCDDQLRKDPARKQSNKSHYGPGPGPVKGITRIANGSRYDLDPDSSKPAPQRPLNTTETKNARAQASDAAGANSIGYSNYPQSPAHYRATNMSSIVPQVDFDLDPLLAAALHGPPWPPTDSSATATATASGKEDPALTVVPAYFRLSPSSRIAGNHALMWLGRLASPTMEALHAAATSRAGEARVSKVHGIVKNAEGGEDSWLIDGDDELHVYLHEAVEKATFEVVLEGGFT